MHAREIDGKPVCFLIDYTGTFNILKAINAKYANHREENPTTALFTDLFGGFSRSPRRL